MEYVPATSKEIWLIFPYLCVERLQGNYPVPEDSILDEDITDLVEDVCARIFEGDILHLPINVNSFIVSVCVYMRYHHIDHLTAYRRLLSLFDLRNVHLAMPFDRTKPQILRYRKPLHVIFCGDRNSAVCFEEQIVYELKALPKYSTVYHGGCRGVDLYVDELARAAGIKTLSIPAEWSIYGNSAGPIRNKALLSHDIDMVIAFHPDIEHSKGTKNMMVLAYQSGIPVYIHDLKRKERFEGDFSVL